MEFLARRIKISILLLICFFIFGCRSESISLKVTDKNIEESTIVVCPKIGTVITCRPKKIIEHQIFSSDEIFNTSEEIYNQLVIEQIYAVEINGNFIVELLE